MVGEHREVCGKALGCVSLVSQSKPSPRQLTACIADIVAMLVPSPQRRNCRAAVVARNNHCRIAILALRGCHVDFIGTFRAVALYHSGRSTLTLDRTTNTAHGRTLGHPIVVRRAAAASYRATCAVATAAARTCPTWHSSNSFVLCRGRRTRCVGGLRATACNRRGSLGVRAWYRRGRSLQVGRPGGVPRFQIQATGVAYGRALR